MAGSNDRDNPHSYSLTDYASYRAGITAVDSATLPGSLVVIDLTGARHAYKNRIHFFIEDATEGATVANGDTLTVTIWRMIPAIGTGIWYQVANQAVGVVSQLNTELILDNLLPGKYVLRVDAITTDTTWNIYMQTEITVQGWQS